MQFGMYMYLMKTLKRTQVLFPPQCWAELLQRPEISVKPRVSCYQAALTTQHCLSQDVMIGIGWRASKNGQK